MHYRIVPPSNLAVARILEEVQQQIANDVAMQEDEFPIRENLLPTAETGAIEQRSPTGGIGGEKETCLSGAGLRKEMFRTKDYVKQSFVSPQFS